MEKKMYLPGDPETATFMTGLEGWVDRHGHYFGVGDQAEHMARYSGSTHRLCDCGEIIDKRGYCRKCYDKKELEKYYAMPRKIPGPSDTLYSEADDEFFYSWDDVVDHLENTGGDLEGLWLVICEPVYPGPIDPDEYYCEDLPDNGDGEVPSDVREAFDVLNATLQELKTPLCWRPGKYAVDLNINREG